MSCQGMLGSPKKIFWELQKSLAVNWKNQSTLGKQVLLGHWPISLSWILFHPCNKQQNETNFEGTCGKPPFSACLNVSKQKTHSQKREFDGSKHNKNGDFWVLWHGNPSKVEFHPIPTRQDPDSATSSFFWLAVYHTVGGLKISNPNSFFPSGRKREIHVQLDVFFATKRHFVRLIKYCKKTIAKIRVGINGLWARRQGRERNVGTWQFKNFDL